MSVLVTGGTGFVGSYVVRRLVEAGERPVVFDIRPNTQQLAGVLDRVDMAQGDLGNFSQVLNAVKKVRPEVIYHLGGMLSVPSDAEPAAALSANALGTFHTLEAARLFEVPKVVFSSTISTYGMDIGDGAVGDNTLQRPFLFYGATKVFAEHMGIFFKRKYGLDFRGVRLPAIVGPGVRTPGIVQYNAWVIESCAMGRPFTMWVRPETRHAVLYCKDAALAVLKLAEAPLDALKRTTYTLAGIRPMPSAGELADAVREQVPGARIDFKP
ncbi:MAG: NAD-dependent epimerase/dehydratase family protein, partial [bacterium]|nr:NAD-dependent epimerase/dehydratase family protein [bacterium]